MTTPTLAAEAAALPPEGAQFAPWDGPAAQTKNPHDIRRTGLALATAGFPDSQPDLALAEFFTRPQAEAQIGA